METQIIRQKERLSERYPHVTKTIEGVQKIGE